jgi:hypothetical protein
VAHAASMGMGFAIKGWAACAPGLAARSDWLAWSRSPTLPEGPVEAPLAGVPPLLRRRLNGLGRLVAQVAWDCQPDGPGVPVVLASRYGDAARALQLLRQFTVEGLMSPTDFALSVHNAIGAMYSIARGDTQPYSSVSAGAASAAAGWLEAAALLADGAGEVLLVCYDAPLPGEYQAFADEPSCAYAWAWRLSPASAGEPSLALSWDMDSDDAAAAAQPVATALPFGLDVLRFMLSGQDSVTRNSGGTRWTWSRQHA